MNKIPKIFLIHFSYFKSMLVIFIIMMLLIEIVTIIANIVLRPENANDLYYKLFWSTALFLFGAVALAIIFSISEIISFKFHLKKNDLNPGKIEEYEELWLRYIQKK